MSTEKNNTSSGWGKNRVYAARPSVSLKETLALKNETISLDDISLKILYDAFVYTVIYKHLSKTMSRLDMVRYVNKLTHFEMCELLTSLGVSGVKRAPEYDIIDSETQHTTKVYIGVFKDTPLV